MCTSGYRANRMWISSISLLNMLRYTSGVIPIQYEEMRFQRLRFGEIEIVPLLVSSSSYGAPATPPTMVQCASRPTRYGSSTRMEKVRFAHPNMLSLCWINAGNSTTS